MPTACPGAHNNAWRRAEAETATTGIAHDLQPTWGQPVHCERCRDRAHRELAEIPELIAAISLEATNATNGMPVGTIGRSPTHPAWPGQAARLLTDHIVGALVELESDIRELRNLAARSIGEREGVAATQAVAFLTAHLDWALEHHPAAGETHDRLSANPAAQIHQWHRAATRFTARDERLDHHRVPCPRCELLTLFRADGDDYIECRNTACGLLLTSSEYLEHTKTVAAGYALKAAS